MAKVSLRGYNAEIDQLIDNNQLDEAIAHCIHILGVYPKHADTYRLLGKAFLERQRYNDAADMFLRVLAIFPDDFVAHIGISIVREELSDLDLAVFHMERAFEVQPTNTAIQDELKRLYGKRDGVAPSKIRLTHPALARLYAKGDLNQQALGELSVALADTPSRPDILAQLAELYTKDGQNSQAIETCNKLIENLPYCFGALNVLTRLLPGSPFAQDVPIYQARIVELDPYYEFKTNNAQAVSDVPDDAVMIEPLVWSSDSELAVNKTDWANTLGIKLIEPQQVNAIPVQKKSEPVPSHSMNEVPTQPRVRQPVVPEPTEPAPPPDLPDWMQSAGWSKSDDTSAAEAAGFAPEKEVRPVPTMPPSVEPESTDRHSFGDADLSPALQKIRQETDNLPFLSPSSDPSRKTGDTDSFEPAASISPEAIPDWLRSIAPPDITTPKPEGSLADESGISKEAIDDAFSSLFPAKEAPLDINKEPEPLPDETPETVAPEGSIEQPAEQPVPAPVPVEDKEPVIEADNGFSLDDLRKEMDTVSDLIGENAPESQPESVPEIQAAESPSEVDALEDLRSSFPSEQIPEEEAEPTSDDSGVPTGPLAELEPEEEVEPTPEPAPAVTGEIPNWLQGLGDSKASSERQPAETADDELPAWLQDFEQKIEEQPPAPAEPPIHLDTVVVPGVDRSGESSGWRMPQPSKTDSKFHTQELPELTENEPPVQHETTALVSEEAGVKTAKETSELPAEPGAPPFSGGDTTIIAPVMAEETNIEERPAWLSKLIGIDDIEPSTSEEGMEEPSKPAKAPAPIENIDEISGASQAAWIVDMMASKEPGAQTPAEAAVPQEEPPASTVQPEEPVTPEAEPVAAPAPVEPGIPLPVEQVKEVSEPVIPPETEPVVPAAEPEPGAEEAKETPEAPTGMDFGEREGVPDLSLIVEGLQAAWMSEHVEDGKTKHTGSLMDIYAPKPGVDKSETIIIDRSTMKPVEIKPEQAETGKTPPGEQQPVPSQPEQAQAEMPQQAAPQPEIVQPEEAQPEPEVARPQKREPEAPRPGQVPLEIQEPEPPQPAAIQPEVSRPEPVESAQTIRIPVPDKTTPSPSKPESMEIPPASKPAQPVTAFPAEDVLKDARAAFTHGVLDQSLDRYVELITHNRLVESVIEDLEAMTTSQSDHSEIWQTLGDAYIRRNKLDQALSAYLKAEELLK